MTDEPTEPEATIREAEDAVKDALTALVVKPVKEFVEERTKSLSDLKVILDRLDEGATKIDMAVNGKEGEPSVHTLIYGKDGQHSLQERHDTLIELHKSLTDDIKALSKQTTDGFGVTQKAVNRLQTAVNEQAKSASKARESILKKIAETLDKGQTERKTIVENVQHLREVLERIEQDQRRYAEVAKEHRKEIHHELRRVREEVHSLRHVPHLLEDLIETTNKEREQSNARFHVLQGQIKNLQWGKTAPTLILVVLTGCVLWSLFSHHI
jgi:chromosome segregation ATPase